MSSFSTASSGNRGIMGPGAPRDPTGQKRLFTETYKQRPRHVDGVYVAARNSQRKRRCRMNPKAASPLARSSTAGGRGTALVSRISAGAMC